MTAMTALTEAERKITDLAAALLAKRGLGPPSGPDQPLKEAGLSSLDLVNLMLAVEEAFDVFIPEDKMTPARLKSVSALTALVMDLRAPS